MSWCHFFDYWVESVSHPNVSGFYSFIITTTCICGDQTQYSCVQCIQINIRHECRVDGTFEKRLHF